MMTKKDFLALADAAAEGLDLAHLIVDHYGEALELGEDTNGADLVDYLAQELYPAALALVQEADAIAEGR